VGVGGGMTSQSGGNEEERGRKKDFFVGKWLPRPWAVYGLPFPSSAIDSPKAEAAGGL